VSFWFLEQTALSAKKSVTNLTFQRQFEAKFKHDLYYNAVAFRVNLKFDNFN
jgi:hypothetical protein